MDGVRVIKTYRESNVNDVHPGLKTPLEVLSKKSWCATEIIPSLVVSGASLWFMNPELTLHYILDYIALYSHFGWLSPILDGNIYMFDDSIEKIT